MHACTHASCLALRCRFAEVAALPPTRFESHSALQAYEHALLKTNFPIREESSSSSSSSASASAPSASSSSSSSSAAAPAQEQQEEEEEEKKEVSAAAASLPPASSSASHALRRGSSGGLSYAGYAPSTNSSGGAAVGLRANVRNVMTAYETAVKDVQVRACVFVRMNERRKGKRKRK